MSEDGSEGKREYPLGKLWRRLTALEWRVLLLLALIVGGAWLFAELADVVLDDEPGFRSIDEAIILALREPDDLSDPIGSADVETALRDITALGGIAILGFITISSAIFLLLRGNRRTALILLVAIIVGTLLSLAFKDFYARPRPELVPVETRLTSYSFPSGHSMLSAVTYLTIGVLLARTQMRRAVKVYILLLSVLLTGAVGFSRVYLGVHWPTDVLAGWTAGVVWALGVALVTHYLR